MSDITLFQSSNLPDYLKEVELDDLTKSLAGNTSTKRISIRGSVFRLMVSGEEVAKNENRAMNIVIVNGGRDIARQYYAGKYVAGETAAPDCWSNDGKRPDPSIESPQAATCEGCSQNIKGSGNGDSRACRFQQRLAVLLADDIEGDVYQLTLPSTSIFGRGDVDKMPFQQYAKYVGSQGKNINTLVTEMRLDSDSDTPKLTFKPVKLKKVTARQRRQLLRRLQQRQTGLRKKYRPRQQSKKFKTFQNRLNALRRRTRNLRLRRTLRM
jgi:hypothetical protein